MRYAIAIFDGAGTVLKENRTSESERAYTRGLREVVLVGEYPGGEGGLIALDRHGKMELPFNTASIYCASKTSDSEMNVGNCH